MGWSGQETSAWIGRGGDPLNTDIALYRNMAGVVWKEHKEIERKVNKERMENR